MFLHLDARLNFHRLFNEAIEKFAKDTADGGPAVLLGTPWVEDGKLYNAYALLAGGAIEALRGLEERVEIVAYILRGTPADFIIASEESHGILATPAIRDKDSGAAVLLLADLALGSTVAPAVSASAAGSSPKSTLSTWSGVATMMTSTSAPQPASSRAWNACQPIDG